MNQQWVTVATFDNMPDAYIAQGLLEAEGIACYLQDENLVQTDWLYSIAVGGIKLRVPQSLLDRAQQLLAQDRSDNLDQDNDGDG